MICETCKGFGNVKDKPCTVCKGRGVLQKIVVQPMPLVGSRPRPSVVVQPMPKALPTRQQPVNIPPQRAGALPPFVLGAVKTTIVVLGEGPDALSTIHSALALPDKDLEVLFVDDGSTDETAILAATISDPRFLILRRPWKSGRAKELGMAQASGQRVLFLNAGEVASL